jgi:hypothetical protein
MPPLHHSRGSDSRYKFEDEGGQTKLGDAHSPSRNILGGFSSSSSSSTAAAAAAAASVQGGVRLKDLCPEDKAKVGELMKRLAQEKEEKEKALRELEHQKRKFDDYIEGIKEENQVIIKDSEEMQSKFAYSLNLLKSYQESQTSSQSKREVDEKDVQTEDFGTGKFKAVASPHKRDASNSPRTKGARAILRAEGLSYFC